MPIYLGAKESPLEEYRRVREAGRVRRGEANDVEPAPSLFGDELAPAEGRKGRARQLVVWCAKCNRLDSVFLGGGVSVTAARCVHCGGEVVTGRSRWAKLKFYDAIMRRNRALVVSAAHGKGDIDEAANYAEYAAHTAFKLRLVPYGPEPSR